MTEIAPGGIYTRKLAKRGATWRRVVFVTNERVIYATPSGHRRSCLIHTFLRWADRLNRFTPKAGPLL